ncbi:hypothetical protein PPL_11537 [Heterostelium album PN500]|uniref:Uncharacterized protein n=1 Tax=Heterostelium pallidum (strain ATCC 26659 / Pp 5 / PN500) TaxID=670386 RepID=D3BVE6_HETP5|nr:hypothetical protein PPL_11537 [Heterostelium album PN500]EFA74569.1 hypothetical protein PPL_11537 [Heterostelium album PN500]|eukprot:XP_020426703.1 hypothetical protein PPL_11537 [Heterostelium album PN500]
MLLTFIDYHLGNYGAYQKQQHQQQVEYEQQQQQQQQQQPNVENRKTETTRYDTTSNGQRRVSSGHRAAIEHITPNKAEDDDEEQTEWLLKDKSSIKMLLI